MPHIVEKSKTDMKNNETYREARRCANCHYSELRSSGQSYGYYCNKWNYRCSKNKVCDKHLTSEEYEIYAYWPQHKDHFKL